MKRKVDGVLLLDKPAGLTFNAALQKAKRLYRAEKAGHTGTLDPFATGLLPVTWDRGFTWEQIEREPLQLRLRRAVPHRHLGGQ